MEKNEKELMKQFFDGYIGYKVAGNLTLYANTLICKLRKYGEDILIYRISINEFIINKNFFLSSDLAMKEYIYYLQEKNKKLKIWEYNICHNDGDCMCSFDIKGKEALRIKKFYDFGNIKRKKRMELDEFLRLFYKGQSHRELQDIYTYTTNTTRMYGNNNIVYTHVYINDNTIYTHYMLMPVVHRLADNEILFNPNIENVYYYDFGKSLDSSLFKLMVWYAPDCEIAYIPFYFIEKIAELRKKQDEINGEYIYTEFKEIKESWNKYKERFNLCNETVDQMLSPESEMRFFCDAFLK